MNPTGIAIRPAAADDTAALHRLVVEMQEHERAIDPRLLPGDAMAEAYTASMLERCARHGGGVFVAVVGDEVVGLVGVACAVPSEELDEPPGDYALIMDLVVAATHRGEGTGHRLLEHAEAYARARGHGGAHRVAQRERRSRVALPLGRLRPVSGDPEEGSAVSSPPLRVLVTGGTGRLGSLVVVRPGGADLAWRVLTRRPRADLSVEQVSGDLVGGSGVADALAGMDAVLHLASNSRRPSEDVQAMRHLIAAAEAAGVRHLAFLSILGVDRIPYAYYQAKWEAERMLERSRVPWTILRAAQFHSFVDFLLGLATRVPGLVLVPAGFRVQSVDDREVADRLIDVLRSGPSGRLRDFAGPEILSMSAAARTWVRVRRRRRLVLPLPIPGVVARAFRTGANTSADAERGRITWRAWLEAHAQRPAD